MIPPIDDSPVEIPITAPDGPGAVRYRITGLFARHTELRAKRLTADGWQDVSITRLPRRWTEALRPGKPE